MDSSRKEIGQRIKEARDEMGLTQSDVANKADVNVNYYARIERGEVNPSIDLLERILKALKIKSSKILPF